MSFSTLPLSSTKPVENPILSVGSPHPFTPTSETNFSTSTLKSAVVTGEPADYSLMSLFSSFWDLITSPFRYLYHLLKGPSDDLSQRIAANRKKTEALQTQWDKTLKAHDEKIARIDGEIAALGDPLGDLEKGLKDVLKNARKREHEAKKRHDSLVQIEADLEALHAEGSALRHEMHQHSEAALQAERSALRREMDRRREAALQQDGPAN